MPLRDIRPEDYEELLAAKAQGIEAMYESFNPPSAEVYASAATAFRLRAEFRLWHEGEDLYYAMFQPGDPRTPHRVDVLPIAGERIQQAMPALRDALLSNTVLRQQLFQVEFLSTLSGELLITLIYHRPLDEVWLLEAGTLETQLNAHIIGRSRKQKLTISADFVEELLTIGGRDFRYRQYEQGFTQPNARVNCQMIEWACRQADGCGGDLLELYCGNGNFTMPLTASFDHVLATEVSKNSIKAAIHNRQINGIDNLELARLSAEEVSEALRGERVFRRLQSLDRDLADYRFSTVFVDPPRAGLDPATIELVRQFDNIIYISCNPVTQVANLEEVCQSHEVVSLALFDQFPYTRHMECGVLLRRKESAITRP
jgi:tRNA (uracil-5-)-methyltransferase